jgi:hypothetical protein
VEDNVVYLPAGETVGEAADGLVVVARRLDASGSGAWMSAIWRMGVTSRVRTAGRMEGVREVLAWGKHAVRFGTAAAATRCVGP